MTTKNGIELETILHSPKTNANQYWDCMEEDAMELVRTLAKYSIRDVDIDGVSVDWDIAKKILDDVIDHLEQEHGAVFPTVYGSF